MPDLTLHFKPEPEVSAEAIHSEIQQSLKAMDSVQAVDSQAASYRLGPAEIMAGVTLAITGIKTVAGAVDAITKFVNSVSALVKAGKGLREAIIDVGMRKVPVTQLTPADIQQLAEKVVAKSAATA